MSRPLDPCTCTQCRPWFLLRSIGTLLANLAVLALIGLALYLVLLIATPV